MRDGLDAGTAALYSSEVFGTHWKLLVANGDGTYVNLFGRYFSMDWRLPNPRSPVGSLSIALIRELTADGATTSLAPLIKSSTFNKLDDGTTYSPLLQLGRSVKLEVALTAVGGARPADGASTWYEVFNGVITAVDFPEWDPRQITVDCNDLGGKLQTIKSETAYTYDAGDSIETVAAAILSNNGLGSITAYFPAATGKVLPNDYAPGIQKTVWEQLQSLAEAMGWSVHFMYRGTNPVELRFFEPARTKTTPDATISKWWDFKQLSFDESEVRNVGYVQYYDEDGVQQTEGPDEDTASIAKYGGYRRAFWIALEEDSPVRSQSEAADLLAAALVDVADPDVIATVRTAPLVFAEPGTDLYAFAHKSSPFFDQNQSYAPFEVAVRITGSKVYSDVGVRGKPSAGNNWWRTRVIPAASIPTINSLRLVWKPQADYWTADLHYDLSGVASLSVQASWVETNPAPPPPSTTFDYTYAENVSGVGVVSIKAADGTTPRTFNKLQVGALVVIATPCSKVNGGGDKSTSVTVYAEEPAETGVVGVRVEYVVAGETYATDKLPIGPGLRVTVDANGRPRLELDADAGTGDPTGTPEEMQLYFKYTP